MAGCCSAITCPLIRRLGNLRREPRPSRLNKNRRHSPIHILNDDVLLNIFHLYRLTYPDEYDGETGTVIDWRRQRWWYKLAHVCRLWRNIILESPSRLDLHLFCTNGVPVADMLAHSPPLPLTISYHNLDMRRMTAEDESSIFLALSHRDRVRNISFWEFPDMCKFVTAMDGQFPILERMYIRSLNKVDLPVTFQAPNLLHLSLCATSVPIGSPLLNTTASLVALSLLVIPASAYFPPSYLLTWLSLMVQLERLSIGFDFLLPNHDVEGPSHQTLDKIKLPNLQRFQFHGVSAYLNELVARISAPSLNSLRVYLHNQPPFIVPRLLQFVQTSKNLTFTAVRVTFDALSVSLYAVPWNWDTPLLLKIWCGPFDFQVASAAQLLDSLSPIFSAVEKVTIGYQHRQSSERHNNSDQIQWRELLRPFTSTKVIHLQDDLVGKIFRSLPYDNGEPPLELLPSLEEVGYSGGSDVRDALTTFLDERQAAGHPVSLRLLDPSTFDEHPAL